MIKYRKLINRLNTKFIKKYILEELLLKVFLKGGKEKDLKYKKEGSW